MNKVLITILIIVGLTGEAWAFKIIGSDGKTEFNNKTLADVWSYYKNKSSYEVAKAGSKTIKISLLNKFVKQRYKNFKYTNKFSNIYKPSNVEGNCVNLALDIANEMGKVGVRYKLWWGFYNGISIYKQHAWIEIKTNKGWKLFDTALFVMPKDKRYTCIKQWKDF